MELKPCPFCGCKDLTHDLRPPIGGTFSDKDCLEDSITCSDCGIGFSSGVYGWGIKEELIWKVSSQKWNARYKEKQNGTI